MSEVTRAEKITIFVAKSKKDIPSILHSAIVSRCENSLRSHGCFTVALSGGSLPSFLANLKSSFDEFSVDPLFDRWYVFLTDERLDDTKSNLNDLKRHLFDTVNIPKEQIFGVDYDRLEGKIIDKNSGEDVAAAYERELTKALRHSGGKFDCVVLGFGPDGHTCSLFPGSDLCTLPLEGPGKVWVAYVDDSPKPPRKRITLTMPVLNEYAMSIIFCGSGKSKSEVVRRCFGKVFLVQKKAGTNDRFKECERYDATMNDPLPPFPCAMVRGKDVVWIIDSDAANGLAVTDDNFIERNEQKVMFRNNDASFQNEMAIQRSPSKL